MTQGIDGFAVRRYRVAYRPVEAEGVGATRVVEIGGCEPFATQDLLLLAHFDGEVLSFSAEALVPVQLESFQVELAHAFAWGEQVLLNGYQSWTTTEWLPATATERGLGHVPKGLVDRYALDGIGDYRFTEYGNGAGQRHGYTYAAFRVGDAFSLVASLDEKRGFTLVRTDAHAGTVVLEPECPAAALIPECRVSLGSVAFLAGAEDAVYDRWFELSGMQARPVRPLVGYSSWYRHYGDIDQAKLERDLGGAASAFTELGLLSGQGAIPNPTPSTLAASDETPSTCASSSEAPSTRVILSGARSAESKDLPRPKQDGFLPLFQIDDGYCKVGDWAAIDCARFPEGLAPLAARIRKAGFLPGLWMAPFVCERESRLFAEHPDWLLRDLDGNLVRTGPHWSGAFALDTRNPQVRQQVRASVREAVREWGFGLLKLDFLYAACLVPHDGLNRGQLMADAMALLREAAGEECLLLACGVPLASAFGVADYCRIGCDVGLDWDDKPHMRLLHHERVSTKNSLGNTVARAPLDGRAFANDPDVFFLRDDVKLSAARRRQLLQADAAHGSMLLTSDDMGAWGAAERELFQAALKTMLERKG